MLAATLLLFMPSASALTVPPLAGHVNDRAGLLEPHDRERLEAKLAEHEGRTGQQMVLLVLPSLEGDPIEDVAFKVFNDWKLGKKGKDDGLLLLIVTEDRRVRVEVGDGLEGTVTDLLSGRVIRDVIAPAFRARDYIGGIDGAFDVLMTAAAGGAPQLPDAPSHEERRARRTGSPAFIVFLVLFLILSSLGRRRRRSGWLLWGAGNALLNSRSSGGFFGGGGGFSGGGGRSSGGGASGGW